VDERQARGDGCEDDAADQQDAPRAQQRAEVDGQRADEHGRRVERRADPRALVEADAEGSSEIGKTQREETSGQTPEPGAHDDGENAEPRAVGQVGRQHGAERSDAVGRGVSGGGRSGGVRHGSLD
jgi:hypothetical protein